MDMSFFSSFPYSDHIYSQQLMERQRAASGEALRNFRASLVYCPECCQLGMVKNILVERGIPESCLNHLKNDIADRLVIHTNDYQIELNIPLFPKQKKPRECRVEVRSHDIHDNIKTQSTSESVVEYLQKLTNWLPEYEAIKEQLKQKQEQEKLAKNIALDILRRVAGKILDEKGYGYQINKDTYINKAILRINTAKTFTTTLEVDLLGNFHDDLVRQLEAMPNFSSQ